MPPLAFLVTIPVREEDAQIVIDAFLDQRPYAPSPYKETVLDQAGNTIPNPITKAMYVEDCIAYYIMDITRNHLITEAANTAKNAASAAADTLANDLSSWINTQIATP